MTTRTWKVVGLVLHTSGRRLLRRSVLSLLEQTRPLDGLVVLACGRDPLTDWRPPGDVPTTVLPGGDTRGTIDHLVGSSSADAFLVQRTGDWSVPTRAEVLVDRMRDSGAAAVVSSFVRVPSDPPDCVVVSADGAPGRVDLGTALLRPAALQDLTRSAGEGDGGAPGSGTRIETVPAVLCTVDGSVLDISDLLGARRRTARPRPLPAIGVRTARARRPTKPRSRPRAEPPLFVTGARAADARLLAWAAAQHPALLPVLELSWMERLAHDAVAPLSVDHTTGDAEIRRSRLAGARVAFEHAIWEARPSVAASPPAGDEQRWIAPIPPDPSLLAAACALYPDAAWIHVLASGPDPSGADASAVRQATLDILEVERWLAPDRLRRVRSTVGHERPTEVVDTSLRLVGLEPDPRCAAVVAGLAGAAAPPSAPADFSDAEALQVALLPLEGRPEASQRLVDDVLGSILLRGRRASTPTAPTLPEAPPPGADEPPIDCRQLVAAHVPGGSTVSVVSRGDDELLDLGDAAGWHFPRTPDGRWAGAHPVDGAEAVAELERALADGAEFLLVPPPSSWWLDFYDELRETLHQQYVERSASLDGGRLFDLRSPSDAVPRRVAPNPGRHREHARPRRTHLGARRTTPSPPIFRAAGVVDPTGLRAGPAAPLEPAPTERATPSAPAPAASLDTPLVSVVVTTFDVEDCVEGAIESLARQTYHPLEIVAVDDASTDGTREVLTRLADRLPNLRIVRSLVNAGTYVCRNLGIATARGDLLTFNDADDLSHPDRIRRQVEAWRDAGRREAVVVCDYRRVDEAGEVVLNRGLGQRLSLQTPLVPRAVFEEIGGFDTVRMSGDAELLDRFRTRYPRSSFIHLKEALYDATVRAGSLTAQRGVEADLGRSPDDAARPLEDFLSEPRRRYLEAYRRWHQEDPRPRVEFPLRARPFDAPDVHVRDVPAPARVIAGMATHLGRRELLGPAVLSIAPQVDELHVHLNDYDDPPDDAQLANVKFSTRADHGDLHDAGKFLPVDRLTGHEFLLTVDDDIVYPPDYVARLLLLLEQFGRKVAVGVHAAVLASPLERFYKDRCVAHFRRACPHRHLADVLGTGTMAIHSSIVPVSMDSFRAPGMADLWFALGCKAADIPRVVVDRDENWLAPMDATESIWGTYSERDDLQTRIALEVGGWGREHLHRDAMRWAGDEAEDPVFWRTLGFGPGAELVLPERRS